MTTSDLKKFIEIFVYENDKIITLVNRACP